LVGGVFGGEEAGFAIVDGFGDAAVEGGGDWQAGGHGLEDCVGDALVVAVGAGDAWVEEEMGLVEEVVELGLGDEAGEGDAGGDAELGSKGLQGFGEWALASDGEFGAGELPREDGEGAEGGIDAFLGYEAAGLEETPLAIAGEVTLGEWKPVERDACAMEADFFDGTPEGDEAIGDGLGAGEDEGGVLEEKAHRADLPGL